MNQTIYKKINVSTVIYTTLTITNFNSKNMKLLFKVSKLNKDEFEQTHLDPHITCL